ncbi:centrosomal protein of 57 kDa [Esox lucius]|uniref:Centrosomal protein 57 n=1 Tax=Esox lucius TaxID=8010 RepID=A0A3P8Y0A5_ESOLU|nr:centrosomal protein of 57 kDa [Esox lucius]
MDTGAKPFVAPGREKRDPSVGVVMSDSLSLPSYKDYPAGSPFIKTTLPSCCNTHVSHQTLPSKAFPESSSAAILSALMNLQEKIRRLELERGRAERSLHSLETSRTRTDLKSDTHTLTDSRGHSDTRTDTHKHTDAHARRETAETSDQSEPNQVLVIQLAAAESRCKLLERQLDYMRKTVRNAEADRTALLKRQVSLETIRSADQSHQAQVEKLDLLEQEYQRLTCTQNHAERKIRELELKLLEEEHQRKLVQNKANQLQTGLEASRILIQSVSPRPPKARSRSRERKPVSKALQQPSPTQPHYRLSLGDVPFVAGKSVGCSHSVRANVQSVLSLLKQHQPQLCNARVLSHAPLALPANGSHSVSGSSSSCGEELSDLLLALQDELGHMSLEQQELVRQVDSCVSEQERRELEREQEILLRRMERKGEQISKLRRHQAQVKRLTREIHGQKQGGRGEIEVTTTVTTRGRAAGTVKVRPGDRSRNSLQLLKDMRTLQTSLRPDQPQWNY